jgi:hypothetical protein
MLKITHRSIITILLELWRSQEPRLGINGLNIVIFWISWPSHCSKSSHPRPHPQLVPGAFSGVNDVSPLLLLFSFSYSASFSFCRTISHITLFMFKLPHQNRLLPLFVLASSVLRPGGHIVHLQNCSRELLVLGISDFFYNSTPLAQQFLKDRETDFFISEFSHWSKEFI